MAIYKMETGKPLPGGNQNGTSFALRSKEMDGMKVGQSFAFPVRDIHVVRGDITRLHKAQEQKPEGQRKAWRSAREGEAYRCWRVA